LQQGYFGHVFYCVRAAADIDQQTVDIGDRTMDNNHSASNAGIDLSGLLTITFIVLKLTNVIQWSWWWVLSPVWVSAGILIAAALIIFIVAITSDALSKKKWRK
jgi:membrane protein YdbS with pleckstrin-like domain